MIYPVSTGRMSNKAANQRGRICLRVICFLAGAWVFGQGYAATDNAGDSTVPMPDPNSAGDETTQMPQAATAEPDRREEVFIQIQTRLREAESSRFKPDCGRRNRAGIFWSGKKTDWKSS